MNKNNGQGTLEHAERKRAEKQHGGKHDPADDFSVLEDVAYLRKDCRRVPGNDNADVTSQGRQQRGFINHVRKHQEQEGKKGNNGEQDVIGQGSRQQQTLVFPERLQDL